MSVYKIENPLAEQEAIIVRCSCGYSDHAVEFSYFRDEELPELYLAFHLVSYDNVFRRVWRAIQYIFGHKSRYGNWDTVLLRQWDAGLVATFLSEFAGRD